MPLENYKANLVEKTQLTADVYHLKFALDEHTAINFIPGQYLILSVPQNGTEPLKRLYSIASSGLIKNSFELLVKRIDGGTGSNYLVNLKVDETADFQGPAGVFALKENNKDKVFLATGCGIAPVRSMILSNLKFKILNYYLFWGLPTFKDVYLFDEFKNYKSNIKNFNFKICLSREQNLDMIPEKDRKYFSLGHVDKYLDSEIDPDSIGVENSEFYICGGRGVTDSLKEYLLTKKQIPINRVFFEKF